MRVLTPGRKQKGWAKKFKCTGNGNGGGGCGAKLLVEKEDVFTTCRHYMDGTTDIYYTFECLDCGVLTDFDYSGPKPVLTRSEWLKRRED